MMITEINPNKSPAAGALDHRSLSVEILSQFRNSQTWFSKSDLVESMTELLGQHALNYFCPLRSAFLFQFKSIDSLLYYSPILARDGALTLSHFFFKYPQVTDSSLKIIINQNLVNIVPQAWQKNVLTFSFQSKVSCESLEQKRSSLVIIATMLGPKQSSKEYLTSCLQKFSTINGSLPEEIVLVCASPQTANDPYTQEALLKNYSELILEISKLGIKTEIKTTEQLKSENLTTFYFQDLNEFHFYYSDSFITQILLSQGALDLSNQMKAPQTAIATFPLSFYHELQIHQFALTTHVPELTVETFRTSQASVAAETQYAPEEVSFSNKLCSQTFEGFAYEMSRKLVK